MSSQASAVTVPSGTAEDAVTDNYQMQVVGSRYEATPNTVADGEIRGLQIDNEGRVRVDGQAADQDPSAGRPVKVGGHYNAALPTYTDGDQTAIQTDANGRVQVTDSQALTQLTAIAGSVDGLEGMVDQLEGYTDGLETLATSLNGFVDGLEGFTDGLEAALTTLNANDFATEAKQDSMITELQSVNTNLGQIEGYTDGLEALATSLNGYVDELEGYVDGLETLVTSTNTKLDSVITGVDKLAIVDFRDTTPFLDTSVTNIPASGSSPLTIIASLAARTYKLRAADTTGQWIGVYSDPAGTPALICILNPGMDGEIEVDIPAATVIGLRNMANAAISTGELMIHFLG